MGQYILAANIRYLHTVFNDMQIQFLFMMADGWALKHFLNDPKNAVIREYLYEPVAEEGFEAVWIVKHPSLGKPSSKVLIWFHGTIRPLPVFVHQVRCCLREV